MCIRECHTTTAGMPTPTTQLAPTTMQCHQHRPTAFQLPFLCVCISMYYVICLSARGRRRPYFFRIFSFAPLEYLCAPVCVWRFMYNMLFGFFIFFFAFSFVFSIFSPPSSKCDFSQFFFLRFVRYSAFSLALLCCQHKKKSLILFAPLFYLAEAIHFSSHSKHMYVCKCLCVCAPLGGALNFYYLDY